MAQPVLQVITISGRIVEEGRWPVTTLANLGTEQPITVSLKVDDKDLIKYLVKLEKTFCALEKDGKGKYTVNLRFRIAHFNHMLEPPKKAIESMAFVLPENRTVENVFLAAVGSKLVDARFISLIRG